MGTKETIYWDVKLQEPGAARGGVLQVVDHFLERLSANLGVF